MLQKCNFPVTCIFNASIQSGIFPDDFKMARVAPIFKEGEKGDVSNYRPIFILCTVARAFGNLLYNQLHNNTTTSNVECSDKWQIIDFECSRSTSELA